MNQHKTYSHKKTPYIKSIRLLSLLLSAVLLITFLSACNKEKQPTEEELIEERITTFVDAYNDGDMDTVLSCLDAKTKNAFQAMLNIMGVLAGNATGVNIDLSDLFSLGVSTASGDFMNLEITNINITDDSRAVAKTKMTMPGTENQIIYFVMVYENEGWYINDITDKAPEDYVNNSNQNGSGISLSLVGSVKDGNAYIDFSMGEKNYSGIINSKGEIIYYSEESYKNYFIWTSVGNGAGFITEINDKGQEIYTLFNEDGYKTITSEGDIFDKILGYGDGMILVYKDTSDISTAEHRYGVLDCNGNWIKPLTSGTKLPIPEAWGWDTYKYLGEGIFMSYSYYANTDHYLLYNSNTNRTYFLSDCYIYSNRFFNGAIYARGYSFGYIQDYSNEDEHSYVFDYFKLHSDGTVEEVTKISNAYNDLLIDKNGEYLRILDTTNNTEKEYTSFPSNRISSYSFDGDYILLKIWGADGKTYFTVIDKECNQKIEPIVCQNATISNGRIVFQNSDNIYEVIDVNGNSIISADKGYSYISSYSGGIAEAKNSNDEYFIIGLDGKALSIKLK